MIILMEDYKLVQNIRLLTSLIQALDNVSRVGKIDKFNIYSYKKKFTPY